MDMNAIEQNDALNLDMLESRLEMESVAALAAPSDGSPEPISVCHF